jgi:hypothetical protein
MSTTPDTTTSGGSANADHQASDKGKVASRNGPWRRHKQKVKPLLTTNETMKFEGKCDDLSRYIYDCADPKQAADMYTNTTKEISEYVGRTYKYGLCDETSHRETMTTSLAYTCIYSRRLLGWSEGHLEKQTD